MTCLKIEPKALRFSEELGHRDYLGALLNLGVDRSVVGDILIKDKEAWFSVFIRCLTFLLKFYSGKTYYRSGFQSRTGRRDSGT